MAASSTLSLEGLRAAINADVFPTALAAAVLGAVFHQSIRKIEFDALMYHFMALSIAAFLGIACAYLSLGELSPIGAIVKASLAAVSFNTGLLISIGIYRLFFHRLRKFPGPFWAKLSRFYNASLAAKNVQYFKEVEKMHDKYGDFVRTGPRELLIARKSAVPIIYGPNSECRKSTWYGQTGNDPKKCSIHMTRDFKAHKLRRRAWDKGFSIKALSTYEPRIKAKADLFMSALSARAGKPMDMSAWSMFFSFDVMGEVGFGKDFNNLTSGVEHPAIAAVHEHMTMLGVLSNVPWLLNLLGSIPGAAAGYSGFFNWCGSQIKDKQQSWDPEKYPQDIVSWLLKAFNEKDISSSPSEEALHDDSRVVIIAGSETTATSLATILWYFSKYPATFKKLQKLVDQAMPGGIAAWSYDKAKSITYIDDIINESLRLKPALLTGGYRVTPAKGIKIDEVYIPGDTNVFVPMQLIQTHPRYYKQAKEFIPERFGERREEMGTDEAPFLPFSLGAYSCPGKNLALLSLRITISHIALLYDVGFAPGETGEKFDKDVLDTFTTTLAPLNLVFTPRARN
ncbi:putative benzoate 4-monooxygenase cytochrome P450 [Lophium mytilinum]|uniref:Putative benzoate 4-monooxygenase cytochrome P450 n=1 Tax=Lophium mytilinum TaxID=390894 RepID=A0A6A6QNZ5_9PEZI|nr:putative benzoate 4-monooxygenase cytochrome P450 [Lophium mytilinum]